eukprot:gene2474-5404_t
MEESRQLAWGSRDQRKSLKIHQSISDINEEISSLERQLNKLEIRMCEQAEEKSHLQLKQYERCVLEYIQQVAHDKATKFFGHMTRLANKMKDMYSEQHRLLELYRQQNLVVRGRKLESAVQSDVRRLIFADGMEDDAIKHVVKNYSYRELMDAMIQAINEFSSEIVSNTYHLEDISSNTDPNFSHADVNRPVYDSSTANLQDQKDMNKSNEENCSAPNLLRDLEQRVHELEKEYVDKVIETNSLHRQAQVVNERLNYYENELKELLPGDAELRWQNIGATCNAAMEEAERRVLEDELTKMTAILKHQHETIKQKSNQKEQLANCEQDMINRSKDLVLMSREVDEFQSTSRQLLSQLQMPISDEAELALSDLEQFADEQQLPSEIESVSKLSLCKLATTEVFNPRTRIGSLAIYADKSDLGGEWQKDFIQEARSTLIEHHETIDMILRSLLRKKYKTSRMAHVSHATQCAENEAKRKLGGSHLPDTYNEIVDSIRRSDDELRSSALPEVKGAVEWLEEAQHDLVFAKQLLREYYDQPALSLK